MLGYLTILGRGFPCQGSAVTVPTTTLSNPNALRKVGGMFPSLLKPAAFEISKPGSNLFSGQSNNIFSSLKA